VADGQAWTVDDTSVNIDASASGANLTFSYALSGSTAGVTINAGTGAITGTPTGVDSGTATVTATDQYGLDYTDTFTWTSSLRTQATALDGLGPFSWTVDDTTVNVDATTDFTTNGNTLTYTATGLPTGVSIASNGIISGTPTAASSGTIVITGQDEYGRETTSTTSHTTALRTQATGGADLDLSYPEDSAISTQNLLANWTLSENTPTTLVSISPTLPAGLSAAIVGNAVNLTGTPTTQTADDTYTITVADEYGRQTSDTFTLEITAVLQLTAADLQAQATGTGNVPLALTGDDGTYSWILTATDPAVSPPTRTQVLAGQDHTGSAAAASGTNAITSGTPVNITLPSGLSGNYYAVVADGDSIVFDATPQAIDTTSATLSSVSFTTGTGAGEVDWAFTPNEDSAAVTGYRVSLWADGSTPSDAAIESGTGSVATTTGTAAASVAESGTLTGSDGVIYVPTIFYVDQFGNKTFETYADVTAGSVPSTTLNWLSSHNVGNVANPTAETIVSAFPAAGDYIVAVSSDLTGGDWTLSGTGVTSSQLISKNNANNASAALYFVTTTGAADLDIDSVSGTTFNTGAAIWDVSGYTDTGAITASGPPGAATGAMTATLSSVPSNYAVIAYGHLRASGATAAWSGDFAGGDEEFEQSLGQSRTGSGASVISTTAGSNFTATITPSITTAGGAIVAVALTT